MKPRLTANMVRGSVLSRHYHAAPAASAVGVVWGDGELVLSCYETVARIIIGIAMEKENSNGDQDLPDICFYICD